MVRLFSIRLIAFAFLLLLLPVGALAAQEAPLTLNARPAFSGFYRVGDWLPVQVEIENRGSDRMVEVRVAAPRASHYYAVALSLPGGGHKTAVVYAFLPTSTRRLIVHVVAADGTLLREQPLTLDPHGSLSSTLALVSSTGRGMTLPPNLANGTTLAGTAFTLAELPTRAAGLSSFDALVLDDLPSAELSDVQRNALEEWVLRGGQLVIAGGEGVERTLAMLPPALRPAKVAATSQLAASKLFGNAPAGTTIAIANYEPLADAQGYSAYAVPNSALVARPATAPAAIIEQKYGKGAVTLLAFPLQQALAAGWLDPALFWNDLLHQVQILPAGFVPGDAGPEALVEGGLAGALTSLPSLDLPPMSLLAAVLLAYIALVGPATYLILRRLDRLALGWIVVPLLTIVFALIAYGLGYSQRGGDVVLNQITLVEPLTNGDVVLNHTRSFVGVFSPATSSYSLDMTGTTTLAPLLRSASIQGPWSDPATATQQSAVFLQERAAGIGPARVQDIAIAQWSMRAFMADDIDRVPSLSARIVLDGKALRGEATNNGTQPLDDVVVVQGNMVARLGTLQPGEQRAAEMKLRPAQAGAVGPGFQSLSYLVYGEQMDQNSKMPGAMLPPELQFRIRILDALYSYGPVARNGQPMALGWGRSGPIEAGVAARRVDHQQIELVSVQPRLAFASDKVSLTTGWLAQRVEGRQNNLCFGNQGIGITLERKPVTNILTLPRDLYGFLPQTLTLQTSSDGPFPPNVTVELYDWATQRWVAQRAGGMINVVDPAKFVGSHGQIHTRFSPPAGGMMQSGCLYIDVSMEGSGP